MTRRFRLADRSDKSTVEDENHPTSDQSKPDYGKVRKIDDSNGAVFGKVSRATNGSTLPDQPKGENGSPKPLSDRANHIKSIFGRASASRLGRPHMGPLCKRRCFHFVSCFAFFFWVLCCFLGHVLPLITDDLLLSGKKARLTFLLGTHQTPK